MYKLNEHQFVASHLLEAQAVGPLSGHVQHKHLGGDVVVTTSLRR